MLPWATGRRRWRGPLIAATPGLRAVSVQGVTQALLGERDLFLVTAMEFDDRAAPDVALASEEMRAASRNLRDIAPGLTRLIVLEDVLETDAATSPGVDTVETTAEERP